MKEKEKKPFYKRWWFIVIAIFIGLGIIGSFMPDEDKEVVEAKIEVKAKEKATKPETKTKDEAKPKSEEKPSYSEEDEKLLLEDYLRYASEQEGLLLDIKPLNDDNYDVVYATVVNEVKMLTDNEKQYLVDEWGKSITNLTNVWLYKGNKDNSPSVFFKYEDGNRLADPKMLGGWKIK
ncbi:hypothetical protein [Lederbergia citri]|uniref:Uncharacterized protein n=1 Tax=Lederbergia citri TaxID=2833580 RepID=A0A942TF08_9BACI|nr:hypothetical protein [Lederbergia citri]MBS4195312.1 hypothetical protein [Lederbergia citri]